MKAQLERLTSSYQTLITLLTGVSALVVLLSETAQKLIEASALIPEPIRPHAKWLVIGTLALIAVLTLLQALARRSVLRVKERFLISPHDPAHLVGREQDLQRLASDCASPDVSLVFLTGESGAGKSALVRAGLAPYLLGNPYWTAQPRNLPPPPQLLPILLDGAAIMDWKEGIEKALRRALPSDAETCQKLGIPAIAPDQSPFDWLGSVHDASCRRVLLIFDQMDDYIVTHRERLFSDGKVIPAEKVVKSSSQWKAIANLVRSKKICLLLLCRADTAMYLEAFRFTDPETPVIFRLNREILSPLLDSITQVPDGQPAVVADPEHGWLQLRQRLLRDLADGNSEILPIRLVVALSSLRTFRWLTPGEYQKAGRAAGLERLHIMDVVRRAARAAQLPEPSLLHLLQSLISADASKTQIGSLADLTRAAQAGACPVKLALQFFENEHLLRRIPGEQDEDSFMLYHDQLARGIRDAIRAQDYWNVLLHDRARAYADAIGWQDRWRTLLPLREQAQMFWQRLRGNLRYGSESAFALFSTCRLLPVLLAASLLLLGWTEYQRVALERQAEEVVGGLASRVANNSEKQQVEEWSAFAALPAPARLHGLKFLLSKSSHVNACKETALGQVMHGVLGLEPSTTDLRQAANILLAAPQHAAIFSAQLASSAPWTEAQVREFAKSVIDRMEKPETASSDLSRLGDALGSLSKHLPLGDVVVKKGTAAVVRRMEKPETDYNDLSVLGHGLSCAAQRLPLGDDEVRKGVAILVASIEKIDTNNNPLFALGRALHAAAQHLPVGDGEVKKGISNIVMRMQKSESIFDVSILESVLISLAPHLPVDDVEVKNWNASLVALTEKLDVESGFLSRFGRSVSALAARLPKGDAGIKKVAAALVARMEKPETDGEDVASLGFALGPLAALLPEGDAAVKKGAAILVARMVEPNIDVRTFYPLGEALASLAAHLPVGDNELMKGTAALVKRMMKPNMEDGVDSSSSWDALGSLVARLPTDCEDVKPWAAVLVERMEKPESDNYVLYGFGKTLASFAEGGYLTTSQAESCANILWSFIKHLPESRLIAPWCRLEACAAGVAPGKLETRVQNYLDILKHPCCVAESREKAIQGLEKLVNESFTPKNAKEPDIWQVVAWAQKMNADKGWHLNLRRAGD